MTSEEKEAEEMFMEANWDGSARAVMPTSALLEAKETKLGLKEHAIASPLPYGVGVYVAEPTGDERLLPMYYVSEHVTKLRGRGVKAGWYVIPEVGKPFTLHVTKVNDDKPIQPGHVSVVEIHVDGANIFGCKNENFRAETGTDEIFMGFTESSEYTEGEGFGTEKVRPFKFLKPILDAPKPLSASGPGGGGDVGNTEGAGIVQLRIFRGKPVSSKLAVQNESFDVKEVGAVNEKAAVKEGCSVRVDRAGAAVERPVVRMSETIVHDNKPVGVINVFLREKFWMESRSIIDANGNPFAPRTDDIPVDLTEENDTEGGTANGQDGQPPRKKPKKEFVDLTIVRDNIDLTEE